MQLPTETIDGVSELGVFRGFTGRYDFPECSGLRWRRFGIKAGNVDRSEEGRHMLVAAVLVPSDERGPVFVTEVDLLSLRPSHVVASIVGGQVDAVSSMIGGEEHAADVEGVILSQVFFIDLQHLGRRGGVDFHLVIESKTIGVAEIANFIHPQDDRLHEWIEGAQDVGRRDVVKIPWSYSLADRHQQDVLADSEIFTTQ